MYFLKKSSKILNNKNRWAKISNAAILVVLFIFITTEVVCAIGVAKKGLNDIDACSGWTNVLLQSD